MYAPGQTNLPPPTPQCSAIYVVELPYGKTSQKYGQSIPDHDPHLAKDFTIPLISPDVVLALRLAHPDVLVPFTPVVLGLLEVEGPPQREFHDIHRTKEDNGCEYGIGILMESRILKVMVVEGDEYCQADQCKS